MFSIALGAADPPTSRAILPAPGLEQGPAEFDFVEHPQLEVWQRR